MGESIVRRGHDTFVYEVRPNRTYPDAKFLRLIANEARPLLYIPMAGIKGRTILSATLANRVHGAAPAQTVTVQALSEKWDAATAKWSKQPAVRAGTGTAVLGALADGALFEVDITSLVRSVANGLDHFGWRITTNSATGCWVNGFDSGLDAWTLTIETSDAPQAPSTLTPAGGIIGKPAWVCGCDFIDLGGSTEQSAIRVQVDPAANEVTAWDSDWVGTGVPELDLASTGFPPLAPGATTQWRVQVMDTDGLESEWSDWVTVTYIPKPALILDNPSAGVLWDPTTVIQAHLASGTLTASRVQIANGNDKTRVRYDTGKVPDSGAALAHDLPLKNADGQRIFRDDESYWLMVRAWDRLDRVASAGDPPYITVWEQVAFDDDAALTPVSSLSAEQVGDTPAIQLFWSRAAAPDGWVILRDGDIIARLDLDDVDSSTGSYWWTDRGASPNTWHTYKVKAVVNGVQSAAGSRHEVRTHLTGVWLLTETDAIVIEGKQVSGFRSQDRRATYKLPGVAYDIDIVTAFEGVSGSYAGTIDNRPGRDVDEVRALLTAIRDRSSEEVRLVYGTRSVPVRLRNLSVDPADDYDEWNRRHKVEFEAGQTSEFEVSV